MGLRGTLIAAIGAACLALAAAPAQAGELNVPGVGGVDLPTVPDLPQVPGLPDVPNLGNTVDDVVEEVPPVDNVVPDLGPGDEAPTEPAPAPTEPSPAPAPPSGGGGDATGSSGGGSIEGTGSSPAPASPSDSGGGRGDERGAGRGADGGASAGPGEGEREPGAAATAGDADRAERTVAQQAADREPNLPTRIGEFIADLPTGVLIGLFGLAVIALLMTGRSAWFARATKNLKLQRRSLERDVGVLQAALVPELPDAVGGVGVGVAFRPATGPAAGGDFHDVFELPNGRVGIVVGDVAGHGREALPRTGVMRYTIRAYLEAGLEPRVAIRLTDRALGASFEDGQFASALAATYEPETRRLVYSCAGHPQPIIVGGTPPSQVEVLAAPPIGIGHPSGSRQTTIALDPGSELWMFTDGLIEAPGGEGMIGRAGLRDLLAERPDPATLLNELPGGAERDDLTVVRLQPPEPADEPQPFSVEALLVEHSYEAGEIAHFLEACGLAEEDLAEACERVAAERRLEGQVLIRISRIGEVTHWRVERVESHLGRTATPVDATATAPLRA
jgi:hypothetical protein